ncbi:hypothetical protein TNCT_597751 [Trichonephila clavata]|uniref:Uncharacterized protein n=1 Tax=Trichonephila clavata TaxID=2740835 RepID=A0A8X6G1T3_TRICU|nr:hypothetical protein TNCT_597751 [Trichonephila clavata]
MENPHCINCDKDGHVASLRSCTSFPKIKPKKGEQQNPPNENKSINQEKRPPTKQVQANVSYANICVGENNQQTAPRGITQTHNQESPRSITQNEGEEPSTPKPKINFGSFATYITELQNITTKFPEIFQALEDMGKTTNDVDKLHIFLTGVACSFGARGTQVLIIVIVLLQQILNVQLHLAKKIKSLILALKTECSSRLSATFIL